MLMLGYSLRLVPSEGGGRETASELDLPSLPPLSTADYGRLQVEVPHSLIYL